MKKYLGLVSLILLLVGCGGDNNSNSSSSSGNDNTICIYNQTGNDIDTIDYLDKLRINSKFLKVKIENKDEMCEYNLPDGSYTVYIYQVYWYSYDGRGYSETFLYPKSGFKKLSGGETWNINVKSK